MIPETLALVIGPCGQRSDEIVRLSILDCWKLVCTTNGKALGQVRNMQEEAFPGGLTCADMP
jgi:hypothetical protein